MFCFTRLTPIYLVFSISVAKITVPRNGGPAENRIVNSAVEIANENFYFRKFTVFLSNDVDRDLVDNFLKGYKGTVVVGTKKDGQSLGQVVVLVESFQSFMKMMSKLKPDLRGKSLLGSGAKFLIILLQHSDKINHITRILWSYHAVNSLIISNSNNKTAVYTFFPYKNHLKCQNTEPTLIGYWEDKSTRSIELYSDKMANMKECPLYVSTNKLYHPSTEQKIQLQMVKKALLRLLREVMNFTPIISTRDYVSIDSNRAKNWSDSLNDVISGRANISTCSIPLGVDGMGLLDYTMPYFRVRLAWLAPPVSPGPVWWRLLSPLSGYLWLVLLMVLFFITSLPFALKFKPVKKFCHRYFKNSDKLQSVAIRIWGVLLGQPIQVTPRRFRDFYILGIWIWFTFVIRNVYQSVLIGALKTDTLTGAFLDLKEAVVDHGYRIGGREGVYAYFEHDPLIRKQFQIIKEENFEQTFQNVMNRTEKFVLATSLEYAWAYCLSQGIKEVECGHVLPDSIITIPLVIWMKMHSPFQRPLAVWLARLMETGLLERDGAVKTACCLTKSSDPTPLTIHQTVSCMLCLAFGYTISSAIFVLEILRYKTKKLHSKYQLEIDLLLKKPYPFNN
ncbi:hypothetical protein NE865_04982 [Phthorimaea operculella]|nr:hypothetical protein NE865_04982 [Phthorimaea operculella]